MNALAENRKAFFNYDIIETLEAGIELKGFEVKAVKAGKASIVGAFATMKGGEIFLTNADIPPYQPNNTPSGYEPTRPRRLLLKKSEVSYLTGKLQAERLTLVPIKLYTKGGRVKVALALARGKRKYEKREKIKKRETEKAIRRTLKK
ncbi:MAG: SsrA-binding protein SmpB [Candidatus Harrisonbacteria bacterium]|nr:SsrA-binding protein SmpB [Candidatus Harrisonbacteria bacterium]